MCVTWRMLQNPGTAKEYKRQQTPTIDTNDRQLAQLTDQAPGTIKRAAQGPSCTTPSSTVATHASHLHCAHPARSSPDPLCQRGPMQSTGGLSRTTTQTPPAPAGTRGVPRLGGPSSAGTGGQPRTHGQPLERGRREGVGDEGRGGRAKAREWGRTGGGAPDKCLTAALPF